MKKSNNKRHNKRIKYQRAERKKKKEQRKQKRESKVKVGDVYKTKDGHIRPDSSSISRKEKRKLRAVLVLSASKNKVDVARLTTKERSFNDTKSPERIPFKPKSKTNLKHSNNTKVKVENLKTITSTGKRISKSSFNPTSSKNSDITNNKPFVKTGGGQATKGTVRKVKKNISK